MRIDSIREQLKLTREDMAFYLGISRHMVKAIELGQRDMPIDKMDAVSDLAAAILANGASSAVTIDVTPATAQQIRLVKRLHRKYSRRLSKYTLQLDKMREDHTSASKTLHFFQQFATSLLSANGDRIRQKWVKLKIEELSQQVKESNLTAQELLAIEIAGLQSRVQRLAATGLFSVK